MTQGEEREQTRKVRDKSEPPLYVPVFTGLTLGCVGISHNY